MTTKEKILAEIKDINYVYNDCSKYETIKNLLDEMPEERKKGKWIHIGGDEWECDECSFVLATEGSWEHPLDAGNYYCKHCGADMREEKTDAEIH